MIGQDRQGKNSLNKKKKYNIIYENYSKQRAGCICGSGSPIRSSPPARMDESGARSASHRLCDAERAPLSSIRIGGLDQIDDPLPQMRPDRCLHIFFYILLSEFWHRRSWPIITINSGCPSLSFLINRWLL